MERLRLVSLLLLAVCLTSCGLFSRTNREADLKNDLRNMRLAIEDYARDRDQLPHSLQELVDAKYLKEIPTDPMTRRKDWQPEFDEDTSESKETARGIASVRSNSSAIGSDGSPYSSW